MSKSACAARVYPIIIFRQIGTCLFAFCFHYNMRISISMYKIIFTQFNSHIIKHKFNCLPTSWCSSFINYCIVNDNTMTQSIFCKLFISLQIWITSSSFNVVFHNTGVYIYSNYILSLKYLLLFISHSKVFFANTTCGRKDKNKTTAKTTHKKHVAGIYYEIYYMWFYYVLI